MLVRLFGTAGPRTRTKLLRACSVKAVPSVSCLSATEGGIKVECSHLQHHLSSLSVRRSACGTRGALLEAEQNARLQRPGYGKSPRWWDHSSQSTHCEQTGLCFGRAVSVGPIQGLPSLGGVRTRETALPDTTLRRETWPISADVACDTKGLAIGVSFFFHDGRNSGVCSLRRETDLLRGQPRVIHD
jgi:hypothetical protein